MLNGKELGEAIKKAIDLKIKAKKIRFRKEVSDHFGIKQPSMADWVKKGTIDKRRLPELWRYFADVAGPEHWGMSVGEWPNELSDNLAIEGEARRVHEAPVAIVKILPQPKPSERDRALSLLMPIIDQLDSSSIDALRGTAMLLLAQMPAKQTRLSSE